MELYKKKLGRTEDWGIKMQKKAADTISNIFSCDPDFYY